MESTFSFQLTFLAVTAFLMTCMGRSCSDARGEFGTYYLVQLRSALGRQSALGRCCYCDAYYMAQLCFVEKDDFELHLCTADELKFCSNMLKIM